MQELAFSMAMLNFPNLRGGSGGFSPGARVMDSGLYVHVRPLTATLTSPVGNTLTTRPTCPKDYKNKTEQNVSTI